MNGAKLAGLVFCCACGAPLAACLTPFPSDIVDAGGSDGTTIDAGGIDASSDAYDATTDAGSRIDSAAEASVLDAPVLDAPADQAVIDACAVLHDTQQDPNNCGRCGHSCQGGGCDGGVCQPVVLASPVTYPIAITLDSTNIYWAEDEDGAQNFANGAVRRLPLTSDAGADAAVALGAAQADPTNIAISSGGLYWAGGGAGGLVWISNPTNASPNTKTWTGTTNCRSGLALATNNVYWMTCPANGVGVNQTLTALAIPSQSATAQPLVGGSGGNINCAQALIADSTAVYWLQTGCGPNAGSMWKLLFADPTQPIQLVPQTTLSGPYSQRLAVDDHAVYFSSGTTGIAYAPLAGGNPTAVNAAATANGIAVDAANIYWTDPVQNAVVYAPLPAGKPVAVLAASQSNPYDIQVDDNSVYWSNYANPGAIMKVAKP